MSSLCTVKAEGVQQRISILVYVLPEFWIRLCLEIFNVGHGTTYFTNKVMWHENIFKIQKFLNFF